MTDITLNSERLTAALEKRGYKLLSTPKGYLLKSIGPSFSSKDYEKFQELRHEAIKLLDIIAAEFRTDPISVQCFDQRIVKRAIEVSKELREMGEL